ncbi:MAG: hypothetical protein IJ064_07380 [Bacteroidaceae bacterium]|nr:hypothetical protein [Bacteroidaceae bacterium]
MDGSSPVDGVSGLRITSKVNGNSIFLPAAGVRTDDNGASRNCCFYWTRSVDQGYEYAEGVAYTLQADSRYGVSLGILFGPYHSPRTGFALVPYRSGLRPVRV